MEQNHSGFNHVSGHMGARGMPTITERNEIGSPSSGHTSPSSSFRQSQSPPPPPAVQRQGELLTVDRKWKVEQEIAERLAGKGGPSRIVPVVKWLATVLMGCGVLFLLVASKISFLALATHLDQQKPTKAVNAENINDWTRYTGQMLMIYLVLLVPYSLQLLRAVKNGLCTSSTPWPRATGILACLAVGILEPLGLFLLALKVVPAYGPGVGLLVMACTICLSAAAASTLTCAGYGDGNTAGGFMAISSVLLLGGLAGTVYLAIDHDSQVANLLHLAACLLSLNVGWLPWLQHHMNESNVTFLESSPDVFRQTYLGSSVSTIGSQDSVGAAGLSSSSSVSSSSSPSSDPIHVYAPSQSQAGPSGVQNVRRLPVDAQPKTKYFKKATWKASLILNLTKVLSTSVFCFIFFYVDVADTEFPLRSSFSSSMHDAFLNAWKFEDSIADNQTFWAFGWNLISSLVCYVLVFIVLHTNIQKGSLALPLLLSLPLSLLVVSEKNLCDKLTGSAPVCGGHVGPMEFWIPTAVALVLGQLLSFGKQAFMKGHVSLLKETEVFWSPGYNGAALDSWVLLNWKQSLRAGKLGIRAAAKPPKMRVYICTTMYREDEEEMRQLLESLAKINVAQQQGETFFESHIIFDGGVQRKKISEFALVLVSLLEETLGIKPTMCTKIVTPYGLKLSWALPGCRGKPLMTFNIHLKDNMLVKNKKRWSQIMYMSYVLDFLTDASTPNEEAYILTTDADVKFTPDSVEALLDLMSRDNTIGAVCARTHPMGEGPLVWYQTFEYAVGHWFQKTAEHVMGSVLCAPGCFSVYRCRALRDVVPKYCKKVESAFDFLTKDMGEDRWLCTLMVQSGWRIEYCAASENSTNCPAEFEEFYKQRRRWIASTLANLMLVIREWNYIDLFNERVSVVFLVYQGLLLFSTLIGPSTVVLIVAGGLSYAWHFDSIVAVILQVLACIMFTLVCLYLSQKAQFTTAKILTFLYAAVMCAVAVGTAEQVVNDLSRHSGSNSTSKPSGNRTVTTTSTTTARPPSDISLDVEVSITTIYFGFLVSIYAVAGLVHPKEILCLLHGIWYLLCLPSGYLILTIYSICNLTDSSWGTREGATVSAVVKKKSWHDIYKETFYAIFFCCDPRQNDPRASSEQQMPPRPGRSNSITSVATVGDAGARLEDGGADQGRCLTPNDAAEFSELQASGDHFGRSDSQEERPEVDLDEVPIPVEEWLPTELRSRYGDTLKRHGFDNTLFIKALTEKELNRMGIVKRGHVQFLLAQIALLPAFEIEFQVPTNVKDWLFDIGLIMYRENFRRNHIRTPKEMEILKRFDRKDIARELGIAKEGHIKRLLYAIRMLRDPSEGQLRAMKMRQAIDDSPVHYLIENNVAEFAFWNSLREKCLEPDLKAFGIEAEVKVKLVQLRNNWLTILAVSNTLWLILISTLATKADLTVIGANPVGLIFLFIFGFLFLIQFLAMLIHRTYTMSHYLARASYKYGKPMNTNWSFKDKNNKYFEDTEDVNAIRQIKYDEDRAFRRTLRSKKREKIAKVSQTEKGDRSERTPLIPNL